MDQKEMLERFGLGFSPMTNTLGIEVIELERGRARLAMTLRPQFANLMGMPHGGIIMALADSAMGHAANTIEKGYVAVEFNIYFLATAPMEGQLCAEAIVEHLGRRLGQVKIEVSDAGGKVIARASGLVMRAGK